MKYPPYDYPPPPWFFWRNRDELDDRPPSVKQLKQMWKVYREFEKEEEFRNQKKKKEEDEKKKKEPPKKWWSNPSVPQLALFFTFIMPMVGILYFWMFLHMMSSALQMMKSVTP